jgi:hypothetical protein
MIFWPFPYYIQSGVSVRQPITGSFYSVAQVAYQAHVMAKYGDMYSHIAFFDFDEFVDLSRYEWSLSTFLAGFPVSAAGEIVFDMIAARVEGMRDGAIGGLNYFLTHPMMKSTTHTREWSIRTKFIASTSNPFCRTSGAHNCFGHCSMDGPPRASRRLKGSTSKVAARAFFYHLIDGDHVSISDHQFKKVQFELAQEFNKRAGSVVAAIGIPA